MLFIFVDVLVVDVLVIEVLLVEFTSGWVWLFVLVWGLEIRIKVTLSIKGLKSSIVFKVYELPTKVPLIHN